MSTRNISPGAERGGVTTERTEISLVPFHVLLPLYNQGKAWKRNRARNKGKTIRRKIFFKNKVIYQGGG